MTTTVEATAVEGEVFTPEQTKALEPYNEIKAQLGDIAKQNASLVFDYEDPKDAKLAKSQIHSLRAINGAIDRRHKELKADVLERGRVIDGGKKTLKAMVAEMIDVHQKPLDEIAEREEQRKAEIQEAIDNISQSTIDLHQPHTSAEVGEAIAEIEAIDISPQVYQERMAEATELRDKYLAEMRAGLDAAIKREQEAAELERLRKEAAERERQERERKIAEEAAARAKREAEEKAAREREEAERKAREAEEAARRREEELKRQAEEAKREAAEAERRAKEEAEQRAREAKAEQQRIERERREAEAQRLANKKHVAKVKKEAAASIVKLVGADSEQAEAIVELIASGQVPNVTINF